MERGIRRGIVGAVCVVGVLGSMAWGRYGGGSGTASDPYLIHTAEHLRQVGVYRSDWHWDVHYQLTADIDLAELKTPLEPMGTTVIRFMGDFDGNGKTISNLRIAAASGDNVGLFAFAEVRIHDLGLINVAIDAPQSTCVGALVGKLVAGQVERCFVNGGIVSGKDEVGGLVGYNGAAVSQCYTRCSISGNDKVGGLVGWQESYSSLSQCFSAAEISGGQDVGGLVGCGLGLIRDCYMAGTVRGMQRVGGLVGNGRGETVIWNCYGAARVASQGNAGGLVCDDASCYSSFWDSEVSGPTVGTGGSGRTTSQMQTAATFRGWGRGSAWTLDEGGDYPRLGWEHRPGGPLTTPAFPADRGQGTAKSPYLIHTARELNEIGEFPAEWDRHYRLESDIDLAGLEEAFRTIGTLLAPFTGVFDGNGHAVSNLNCSRHINHVGFFGVAREATIRRLTLVNPRVELAWALAVGALIGDQVEGVVQDCRVQGGSVRGEHFVGGLVGYCTSGTVTRSSSTCQVASGEYSTDTGGLIGRGVRCNVNNCSAGGAVEGLDSVGGLIGWMSAGNVSHCYSVGPVAGEKNVGGLIGLADRTLVAGCFWDTETSGQPVGVVGTGASTADLQKAETFVKVGWDFVGERKNGTAEIWCIDEEKDYPRFYEKPAVPPEPNVPAEPNVPPQRVWADDFEDGEAGPLWQVYEPAPGIARIREINGRLELHVPTAPAERVSAACLSSGWRLDGSQDFSLKVDFHFTALAAGEGRVSIALAPSVATPVGQRAELTAGCLDGEPVHESERVDGVGFAIWWAARGCDNGTLYLSYDAAADELYLGTIGYGPANAWRTMTGLLKGRWSGGPVTVVLMGGSDGMEIKPGEAWLDNFAVDTGTVLE